MSLVATNLKSLQKRSLEYREKFASATQDQLKGLRARIDAGQHREYANKVKGFISHRFEDGQKICTKMRSDIERRIEERRKRK